MAALARSLIRGATRSIIRYAAVAAAVAAGGFELREDDSFILREDGSKMLRE